jgi:hypothetical protein
MTKPAVPWAVALPCAAFLLAAIPGAAAADDCTTAECVRALATRLQQSLGATTATEFTRVWSRRGAGSNRLLYVLPDGTYRRTVIDDTGLHLVENGRWTAAQGVLTLQPTARGATGTGAPAGHAAFRTAGSRKRTLLVPIRELSERFGAATTAVDGPVVQGWFDLNGLEAGRPITAADVPAILKELARFQPAPGADPGPAVPPTPPRR